MNEYYLMIPCTNQSFWKVILNIRLIQIECIISLLLNISRTLLTPMYRDVSESVRWSDTDMRNVDRMFITYIHRT